MSQDATNKLRVSALMSTALKSPDFLMGVSKTARRKVGLNPVIWDLTLTMLTEFSIVVAGLVLVSLVGRLLGPIALGKYLLLRRVAAWLITGVLLGMGNALPRYIAHSVNKPQVERRAYFIVASMSLATVVSVLGLTLFVWRHTFASWLFGDPQLAKLILPLVLMLAGLAAQTAAYGYYRGMVEMGHANAIQFFHFALIPVTVVALLYPTGSIALIVGVTGALTVLSAAVFAWPVFRQLAKETLPKLRPYASEILRYGVGRVPGDFGGAALLTLGPMVTAQYLPINQVGYLLLGCNILLVTGYTAIPLTAVLLSKFSMMLGQNRLEDVRQSLQNMMAAVLELSVFGCIQLVVFADALVRLWVGPQFLPAITVIRLLVLAVPPYLFFMALRSGIDAITVKPRNAGNVLVALVVYLALIAVALTMPRGFLLDGIAGAMVVSLVVLGALTAVTFRDLYDLKVPYSRCAQGILAGLLLGGISFVFRWVLGFQEAPVVDIIFMLFVHGVFLGVLVMLRPPWLRFVWNNAFPKSKLDWFTSKDSPA